MNTDMTTGDWLRRVADLGEEWALSVDASVDAQRALQRRIGDQLFREFGRDPARDVAVTTHRVTVNGGEIRIREYRPRAEPELLPVYVLLHGGAFWLGSIDEEINRAICSQRAEEAGFAVFDVDYRLAPEHPFPTALEDAFAAVTWIVEHATELEIDVSRLVVGGVSAGGNLAAALCLLARERGGPHIHGQVLEVPVSDLREDAAWNAQFAEINGLHRLADLSDVYAPGRVLSHAYLSPAAGDLVGLPPAHIMTAEFDPLRDGGESLASALRIAGNNVSASRHLGQLHGSSGLTARSRAARLWQAEVIAVLKDFASALR